MIEWVRSLRAGIVRNGFKTAMRFELGLLQSYNPMVGQGCSHLQDLLGKDLLPGSLAWLSAGLTSSLATGQR